MKYYIVIPILISIVGFAVLIPVCITQYNSDVENNAAELRGLLNTYGSYVQRTNVETFVGGGQAMQNVYSTKPDLSRAEHNKVGEKIMSGFPGIIAIGYIKKILHSERSAEEAAASTFYNKTITVIDFNKTVSPTRPEYHIIKVVTPYEGNEPTIFLDMNTSPAFPAYQKAMITGIPSISLGFPLIQSMSPYPGNVVFYPVYNGSSITESDRIANFVGCTTIVFNLQNRLIERTVTIPRRNVGFVVHDNRDKQFIAGMCGKEPAWYQCNPGISGIKKNLTIADTTWEIKAFALGPLHSFTYYISLAIGLPIIIVLAIVTGVIIFVVKKQIHREKQLVVIEKEISGARQRFIHYIFHEIRVPFQTIKLGLHNLQKHVNGNEEGYRIWLSVNNSIEHATNILNDMLDVGKMEKGKFTIKKDYCEITSSLELILEGYRSAVEAKGVIFNYSVHPELEHRLFNCDLGRINQCISNFLSNARKFTKTGTIEFSISIEDRVISDPEIWNLRIAVSDTGSGVAAEETQKLFKPYHQIPNSTNEVGTGLGLVIVKNIVEVHGGEVGFESELGKGSIFWFTVPLENIPKPINYQPPSDSSDISSSVLEMNVLIVDDNENNCFAFKTFLANIGFGEVDIACNGHEALQKIEENGGPYDLIFMDYNMPTMDGVECTIEIKRRYNNSQSYIAMVTGAYLDQAAIKSAGADNILQKPVDMLKFKKTMEDVERKYQRRLRN